MTDPRRLWMLSALGLALLGGLTWLNASEPREGADEDPGVDGDDWAQLIVAEARGRADSRGDSIPTLRVDPASPNFEGGEDDDWDQLGRDGRIAQTEDLLAQIERQLHDTDDPAASDELRRRALDALSMGPGRLLRRRARPRALCRARGRARGRALSASRRELPSQARGRPRGRPLS